MMASPNSFTPIFSPRSGFITKALTRPDYPGSAGEHTHEHDHIIGHCEATSQVTLVIGAPSKWEKKEANFFCYERLSSWKTSSSCAGVGVSY